MKKKLVFWTAFNSYQSSKWMRGRPPLSPHPVTTLEWTQRRAELFHQLTLPSILNQKHADFLFIILMDPKIREKTELFFHEKHDERVIYCYEDIPIIEKLREYDEVVMACIDGDDMYSKDAGQIMMDCPAEWMYFCRGYALELGCGQLWSYNTLGTGPFWARRVNPAKMKAFDREKRQPAHPNVIQFAPQELPDNHFCVTIHNLNTSSAAGMKYIISQRPDRDNSILKTEFGQ